MVLLDIKEGILQKFYKYIVIIVITLLISVMYIYTYNNLIQEGKIDNTGFTIADIWIYCFRGKLIEVSNGIAELPSVVYLLFQLIIAFIIGDYAREDYDSRARYIIVRTKSRISWIAGKMVWVWCALSTVYLCMLATLELVCIINLQGYIGCAINTELAYRITGVELANNCNTSVVFLKLLLMSYITSLALGSLQLMVSFIIKSEVGYMMVVMVVILSAYIRNALCIGNAFMYVNTSYISGGIINPLHIIVVSCLVIMISNIILIKKFKRIDIF